MPSTKNVPTLTQISINSLTKLLLMGLDPHFFKNEFVENEDSDKKPVETEDSVEKSVRPEDSNTKSVDSENDCKSVETKDYDKKPVEFEESNTKCVELGNDNKSVETEDSDKKPVEPNTKSVELENGNKSVEIEDSVEKSVELEDSDKNSVETLVSSNLANSLQDESNECDQPVESLLSVQDFLMCLARDLTSHAHCYLHELLFWPILSSLNRLYAKQQLKEMKKIICDIVSLFINTSLRSLDFGSFKMFTEESMFQVVYSRLKQAKRLEKLVFGRSCYWRSHCMKSLDKMLCGMTNLQILHIHYICQPSMLHDLSDSCPKLRELSLKGSKDITDKEVSLIAQFQCLDTLDISGTSVTGKGCRTLILGLPLLIWLTHCPFNCNSDTLIFESRAELFHYIKDQIQRQPVPPVTENHSDLNEETNPNRVAQSSASLQQDDSKQTQFKLKLKNFWLFNTTDEELLLTHLCPELENLRLDFVMQDLPDIPQTDAIRHLPHLSTLALYTYDKCPIQLVTSVIESASRLTTLHLHLEDEWFFVAPIINVLSQSCPNLVHLTIEGDYKGQRSLDESDLRLDFSLPPEGLRNLKEARLSGCITDLRLLHLLIQAPYLQTLHLDGELEWLHDDTFTEAINQNLLLHLQELWFNVSAGVTFSCVRRLLQSSNDLQRVGRLCLMSSATKDGYRDLLSYIRKNNLSTELIWVTDQRDLRFEQLQMDNE